MTQNLGQGTQGWRFHQAADSQESILSLKSWVRLLIYLIPTFVLVRFFIGIATFLSYDIVQIYIGFVSKRKMDDGQSPAGDSVSELFYPCASLAA